MSKRNMLLYAMKMHHIVLMSSKLIGLVVVNSFQLLLEVVEKINQMSILVLKVQMQVSSTKIVNTHVRMEMLKEVKMAVTMIFTQSPASSGQIQDTPLPKG